MEARSDRGGFFREILRTAAEVAHEVGAAVRPPGSPWSAAEPETEPSVEPRPVPAEPVRHDASLDNLSRLCQAVGLGARLAEVQALARRSLRLTLAGTQTSPLGGSRLGGAPDLPPGFRWPTWNGEELVFLGQIRLEDVTAVDPTASLPAEGLLLLFYDTIGQPSGLDPAHRGSCRVILYEGDTSLLEPAPEQGWFIEQPVELSLELTLPRSSSMLVEQLDLEFAEGEAWEMLRERLAQLQGVELEERGVETLALHRLLGHPEERRPRMELECQLASRGIDLSEGAGDVDPRAEQLEPGASEWRLLVQLSSDDEVGFYWGDGLGRLYVWIRERDLVERDTAAAWALLEQL